MDRILVAAAALNQTPLSWEGNLATTREAIRQARTAGAQVLCLPELCVTGYGCEDAFHAAGVVDTALVYATKVAREAKGIVVAFGLPLAVLRLQLFYHVALTRAPPMHIAPRCLLPCAISI